MPTYRINRARRNELGQQLCGNHSCDEVGVYREDQSYYCLRCHRVRQMVTSARQRYPQLYITKIRLFRMLDHLKDMLCPACSRQMVWGCNGIKAPKANLITLQHWNNGRISFLCHSCNCGRIKKVCPSGHRFTKSNTYVNPKGARVCRTCQRLTMRERRAS